MISVDQLNKTYNPDHKPFHAVKNVSFEVKEGEVLGLLGPNGAGKTTTLRILAGIIEADSGNIQICNLPLIENKQEAKRHIGYLSSDTQMYENFNGKEILQLFGNIYQIPKSNLGSRIQELSQQLDLIDLLQKKYSQMSTGQKQRINIARTLLHNPEVLILDEPTNGLDILGASSIIDMINEEKAKRKAIVYSTHILSEIELIADSIAIIYNGKILIHESRDQIIENTQSRNLSEAFLKIIKAEQESPSEEMSTQEVSTNE